MDREAVIRMAREAGLADSNGVVHAFYQLEYFAYLVAEHEREAIWNLLFEYAGRDDLSDSDQSLLKHLLDLIAARWQEWSNKEGACAKVCERMQEEIDELRQTLKRERVWVEKRHAAWHEGYEAGRKAERAFCAAVCDEKEEAFKNYYVKGLPKLCAEAIRARGEK